MIRIVCFISLVVAVASAATGDQYWIAYEGNDFPENEGSERYATDPPAQRWLEDGSLFIDSRGEGHIVDNYTVYFEDGGVDPGPGETFVMRWRLNVHEATLWDDPGVYVNSDDLYSVAFLFGEDYLFSVYEPDVYIQLEPGVFHGFELRSGDMRSYRLYVDGGLAVEGVFFEGLFSPRVGWGDITGAGSLAQWDYFRFGVIPEPSACVIALAGLSCLCKSKRG